MNPFKDTCAVVTGAAGGIGKSLAQALVQHGARVAVADISKDGAQAVAAAIGGGARGYGCDVSDLDQVEALAAAVARDFGAVNFVFANAGVYLAGKLLDTEPQEFQWLFDVNVRGVFNTLKAFAPMVLQQGAGGAQARFILTGSENSVGLPKLGVNTAYTATKHALLALADGLRRDLDGSGARVSIFCPGAVNTGITDSRRVRQARYGGVVTAAPEVLAASRDMMARVAQDPDVTARICLEGVANDEFIIITDPKIRTFAPDRHREVEAALDLADARVGLSGRP
jgi:NAD(P)-dependent dehydrogenase (short-subunit alcohol dehydrogenase family)